MFVLHLCAAPTCRTESAPDQAHAAAERSNQPAAHHKGHIGTDFFCFNKIKEVRPSIAAKTDLVGSRGWGKSGTALSEQRPAPSPGSRPRGFRAPGTRPAQ